MAGAAVLMKSGGFRRPAPVAAPDRTPVGINVGLGAVVVVAASAVAALIPATDGLWRVGVVAAAVGGFAAVTLDPLAVAAVVVLAWMVIDGLLVNQLGELSWAGIPDLYRAIGLLIAAMAGLTFGRAHRRAASAGPWRLGVAIRADAGCDEEEARDA